MEFYEGPDLVFAGSGVDLPVENRNRTVKLTKSELQSKKKALCPEYRCVPMGRPTTTPSSLTTPSPPPSPSYVCTIEGSNIETFDGAQFRYETCNHILAKDTRDRWIITVHKQCSDDNYCAQFIQISQNSEVLTFNEDFTIAFLNTIYTPSQMEKISRNSLFSIKKAGRSLIFISKSYPFRLIWKINEGSIEIQAFEEAKGKVFGLCGLFNGILLLL